MYKRFYRRFLCLCAVLALLCGGLVFAVDPLYHYRVPTDYADIIYSNPYGQNIGIVTHANIDTVITGASTMQNFRADWFDDALGCKAVNLSFPDVSVDAYKTFFAAALKGDKIKTVYFGLDVDTATGMTVSNQKIAGYLADSNPFNDVSYLLSKDVIFSDMKNWFSGKLSDTYNFYKAVAGNPRYSYSEKTALQNYCRPAERTDIKADDYFMKHTKSVTAWLLGCVVNNPETEFVLFIPPKSVLFWDSMVRQGTLDAAVGSLEYVCRELLQCSNARIFCFLDAEDIITDLSLYRDDAHYCTDVSRYMLECFTRDEYALDDRKLDERFDDFKTFASDYDYDALFAQRSPS